MKTNKKIFVKAVSLLTVVVMMSTVFTGCGKQTNDKDEQGRTIITIGNAPQKEGAALDAFNLRKDEFEKNNPDVLIEPDSWTFDIKTFYAKATGGQLPIAYETNYTEIPSIIDSEYAADLTDVLKKRGYDGMFSERVIDVVTRNGKVYGFPFSAYVLGLACNVDLFEKTGLIEADGTPKQPKDWNEVAEFAAKIKEATGVPGMVLTTANNAGGWIFTNIAWSFGTDFMEQDKDGSWKATFDSPECAAALQWVKDLKRKYDVLPANTIINNGEVRKVFGTEGPAMFITAGNIPPLCVQYGMSIDKIGMMAMPAGPKKHVTLLTGDIHVIYGEATEDQVDAGVRWIQTSTNFTATEEIKGNIKRGHEESVADGIHVGIKLFSTWDKDSEIEKYKSEMIDKYANANPNHVRLYNEFVENCPCEIQAEEPVCCQELYGILDNCIQEVLTNKDADCADILEKANADFQMDYLDNLAY